MKHLKTLIAKYRKEAVLGPLFKLLEALFELIVPLVIASMIDHGIRGKDTGMVIRMCLLLILLAGIGLLFSVTAQYFAARTAIGVSTDLRHIMLNKIQSLSYKDLDQLGVSTLITRMTGDINQIQSGINLALRLLLRSPFVVFGAMIMAFTIDSGCALIFVAVIVILLIVVFGIMFLSIPMYKNVQHNLDNITSTTRQNMNGVRVIRAFCLENVQTDRFARFNDILTRAQNSVGRLSALLNPLTYVIINTALILLIHKGALQVESGLLTQGQVIALYNYMGQILVELIKMANLIITLTKAIASAGRVGTILDMKPSQQDGYTIPDSCQGSICFNQVSLRYSDSSDDVLENISFNVLPGETIGIIGGTGSGKSSLVNLIPRFYDTTSGQVFVDGVDVRDFKLSELRKHIGIVPQNATLFKGTIRSNLLWGNPNAGEKEMMNALELAQGLDIIKNREEGLDTPVEQGGTNFSGGQKQRLTIARALVRNPRILILDDSASALDFATDAALRKAIRNGFDHSTVFIVSQRTASVRHADKILVMEDGHLVGIGKHEELLSSCSVYQQIHASQTSAEEVHPA